MNYDKEQLRPFSRRLAPLIAQEKHLHIHNEHLHGFWPILQPQENSFDLYPVPLTSTIERKGARRFLESGRCMTQQFLQNINRTSGLV